MSTLHRRPPTNRKSGEKAQWRTRPEGAAPIVVVGYFGPMRSCSNMCAFLERSGLRVFCGGQYGKALETLCVMPQAIVIRVDGAGNSGDQAREEFRALAELRRRFEGVPLIVCVDHAPSEPERQLIEDAGTCYFDRSDGNTYLLGALQELMSRLPE